MVQVIFSNDIALRVGRVHLRNSGVKRLKECFFYLFGKTTVTVMITPMHNRIQIWRDIRCNIVSGNIFVPYSNMYSILRYLCPIKIYLYAK